MWGQVHVEHYMSDRRTYCHHLEHSRLFKLMAWVYLLKILDEFILCDPVFLLVYHTHCCEKQFSSFMISLLLLFLVHICVTLMLQIIDFRPIF